MLNASFKNTKSYIRLTLNGHADFAEHGIDTICASASILAYTLAEYVNQAYKGGALKKKPTIKLTEGYSKIECFPKDEESYGEIMRAYLYTQIGLQLLSDNYSEYVNISDSI